MFQVKNAFWSSQESLVRAINPAHLIFFGDSNVDRRQLHFTDLNHLCPRPCMVILPIHTHTHLLRLVPHVEGGLQKGTFCVTQTNPVLPSA